MQFDAVTIVVIVGVLANRGGDEHGMGGDWSGGHGGGDYGGGGGR